MCFNNNSSIRIQTATNDIRCYKVVFSRADNGLYTSLIAGFRYKVGKTYTKNWLKTGVFNLYAIIHWDIRGSAFHAFTNNHNWLMTKQQPGTALLECVIPAGTPFLENEFDSEYVSTTIRIVREIKRDVDLQLYNLSDLVIK